jgi:hypothetical protein
MPFRFYSKGTKGKNKIVCHKWCRATYRPGVATVDVLHLYEKSAKCGDVLPHSISGQFNEHCYKPIPQRVQHFFLFVLLNVYDLSHVIHFDRDLSATAISLNIRLSGLRGKILCCQRRTRALTPVVPAVDTLHTVARVEPLRQ